jgi:hypothetical protein
MDQGKLLGLPFTVFCLMSPCPCLHVFMYVSMSSCMSSCLHVCLLVFMSRCLYVSMSQCLQVSLSPCVNVSMSPCLHVHVSITENRTNRKRQLLYVFCKRKTETANFTNSCFPWSAKDKWYRRLLFQQTNGPTY